MALLLRKEIHMIYKITLFDANFPSCTSGTASFFTEDIDEFEHNYFSDENVESNQLEAQKQRYFRSKAGEIVTDYYSDAPELNIFQYAEYGTIEKRKTFHYKDKIFELHNGYLIPCPIYAAEAIVEMAQIAFKKNPDEEGEKYLVARYSLRGVCCKDTFGSNKDKFEDCTLMEILLSRPAILKICRTKVKKKSILIANCQHLHGWSCIKTVSRATMSTAMR